MREDNRAPRVPLWHLRRTSRTRLGAASARTSQQVRPALRGPQEILQVLPAPGGIRRVVVAAPEPADVTGDLGQVVPYAVQRQGVGVDGGPGRGAVSGADPAGQLVEGGQQRTEIRGVTCRSALASNWPSWPLWQSGRYGWTTSE
jgi:hypothetical protein